MVSGKGQLGIHLDSKCLVGKCFWDKKDFFDIGFSGADTIERMWNKTVLIELLLGNQLFITQMSINVSKKNMNTL